MAAMSDTEFNAPNQIKELEAKTSEELEAIVIEGSNLHIHMSKASVAKRILENRRQLEMLESTGKVETVARHLEESNKGLSEIVKLLNFFKSHWFPRQPLWVKIVVFLFGTVLIGILINLAADWIAKFVFGW